MKRFLWIWSIYCHAWEVCDAQTVKLLTWIPCLSFYGQTFTKCGVGSTQKQRCKANVSWGWQWTLLWMTYPKVGIWMNMCKILFISWLFDAGIAIATECWNGDLPFTNQIRQFFRSSQHKTQVSLWIKPAHYRAHHTNTSGTQRANMELRRSNSQIILFSLGSSICSLLGKIKYCVSAFNDFLLCFSSFPLNLLLNLLWEWKLMC